MPHNDGEVRVEITGDSSKIKKELKDTEAAVRNTTEKVSEMLADMDCNSGKETVFDSIAESAENAGETAESVFNNISETLQDISQKMDNLGKSTEKAGEKTVTLGKLLKANILSDAIQKGIGKLTDGFTDFLKKGVELASDLQEVQNVVDTTFGDGAEQIYEWADAAAESFGMSSLQAQNFNGTLGAMLKSMGLTDDAVLKMSTDMVGLAGDMASFYNLDVETAFEKIRAGISGETEPLKQLGINMSVANLEAYALAQGIETAYDKMSQSEQAILRYNYLMAQTADAQGDFAKTSDSFANQQRILQLQTENLAASLGAKLLPSLNNVLTTANDKLPRLENTAENIGEILGKVTEFALENHEAILSLIAAYGTFSGVKTAGTFIMNMISAFKKLVPATQAATAAQEANNAAAAANPYVLAAAAIAALTVGLIAYANSVDSVHNSIRDVNKDVEELKKNTDESIANTEAEIAVFRDKAAQYEELREKANRTAGEEERLKQLAEELQQYMPEGTKLIDEQTGAYNSLADSVDSVAEAMRRKAMIAAYEDEYTELIKKQLEAQKNYDEANEKLLNTETDNTLRPLIAAKDYNDALESLNEVNAEIEAVEEKLNGLYEQQPKKQQRTGETYAEYMQRMGEQNYSETKQRQEQELKDYEENLKAKVAELDDNLSLRRISEEQYYSELKKHLDDNKNLSSKVYFEQLEKYENYLGKKQDAADRAAEQRLKAEKSAAEKLQKEAEAAEKQARQETEKAAKKARQEAEKLLSQQEKTVNSGLSDILKKFQRAYD